MRVERSDDRPVAARSPGTQLREDSDLLFARYVRTHDPHVRERLIFAHQSLANNLAAKFAGRGEPADDLTQVAMIGLIKAVDHFDPSRYTKFSTYAVPTIIGEIKRYFRDCTWIVKVPRYLTEVYAEVARVKADLNSKPGHHASAREICDVMGISEDMLRRATTLDLVRHPLSFSGWAVHAIPGAELSIGDTIGVDDDALQSVVDRVELREAIDQLDPVERDVIVEGYFGGKSQTELGRSLHMSQMQVSRVRRRALSHLRNEFRSTGRRMSTLPTPRRPLVGAAAPAPRSPVQKVP